ncbi:hypothetical protein [Actinospica robiniae]|uniref:hypothetical protein n=1 Tax=Actinospica robiniae TaxID=304901 RepID=UPI0003F9EC1C|nr:hypothetical protein [Actinospica robiniae]
MIRTPRSAAFALLAAAALVSIPGTAFADASAAGHDAGPGFNNGIIINQTYQHIDGNVYNADDDGIVDGLPGAGAPFVQFRLSNRSPFALERTSQQGAEYPRFLLAGSLAFVQTTDPSTADYQSAGAPGTVHIDATDPQDLRCSGTGSLQCRVEFNGGSLDLVVT